MFIMNPDNYFLKVWEIIIFIITMYFLTVTPITVAFSDFDNINFSIIEATMEILFIFDIPINFLTAYVNKEELLVRNKNLIAIHYLKKWFTLDVISSIPTTIILDLGPENENQFNLGTAVSNFTKFLKLLKFLKQKKIQLELMKLNFNILILVILI